MDSIFRGGDLFIAVCSCFEQRPECSVCSMYLILQDAGQNQRRQADGDMKVIYIIISMYRARQGTERKGGTAQVGGRVWD